MITANVVIHFPKGFIAEPYWPEQYRLIEIQKKSGMNRSKSEKGRADSLKQYLDSAGMTYEQYVEMEAASKKPFHTDPGGKIVITTMMECLVNAADVARGTNRVGSKSEIRVMFEVGPFSTDKTEPDGVWERFAVVTAGTGAKLSNQRGLRRSPYIANFDATGTIEFDESFASPDKLKAFLEFAGRVGVGASRSMGWGRFKVRSFEVAG